MAWMVGRWRAEVKGESIVSGKGLGLPEAYSITQVPLSSGPSFPAGSSRYDSSTKGNYWETTPRPWAAFTCLPTAFSTATCPHGSVPHILHARRGQSQAPPGWK